MKKVHWIRQCLVAVLLVTIFALSACSNKNADAVDTDTDTNNEMSGTLSVYYVDYSDQKQQGSSDVYSTTRLLFDLKNVHRDITLESTAFGNSDAMLTQASTELAAGKGPDLLMLDYFSGLSWSKLAKNNAIENLTPYIKKDMTYNPDNYFEPVMKAGQLDGNQYILPFAYNSISLFAGPQRLSEYKTEGLTSNEILSMLTDSVKKANESGDDDIIPVALLLNRNDYLTCLLTAFGMKFVDHSISEIVMDKDLVKQACDFVKELTPYASEAFENKFEYTQSTQHAKKIAYTLSTMPYITALSNQISIADVLDYDFNSILMPKYDTTDELTSHIVYYAAINSNSKNKQLAYNAAKTMMDLGKGTNIDGYFPINKKNLKSWVDEIKASNYKAYVDGNFIPVDINFEHFTAMAEDVQHVTAETASVIMIVHDGMMPYIDGTSDFDECYDETVNKLKLYINE